MEEHYEGSKPKWRGFRTLVAILTCIGLALPVPLVGASFVMIEDWFSVSFTWMTTMLSFHITAILLAKHMCTVMFHRLNFELQLSMCSFIGGGALMLAMYGHNYLGFITAVTIQGLCSGYLIHGMEMFICLLWSNHKAKKLFSHLVSLLVIFGCALCPILIYALYTETLDIFPDRQEGGNFVSDMIAHFSDTANNNTNDDALLEGSSERDTESNLHDGQMPLLMNSSTMDITNSSSNTSKPALNISYAYGLIGGIEICIGIIYFVLYVLLGPSLLRKDGVLLTITKTANQIGQPKCFSFGFVILVFLFSCCYISVEVFPRYLLAATAVHHNNMNVPNGALVISSYEAGIFIGRILSIASSCIISTRILLNISLFLSSLSFLFLLCALTLGDLMVYTSSLVIGVSVANIHLYLFQWACSYIMVTSSVRFISVLGCVFGCIVGLPIAGFLVTAIGYVVIAYMLIGASLALIVVFIILQVYASAARPVHIDEPSEEELRTFAQSL